MTATKGCRYCTGAKLTIEHALATQLAELITSPASLTAERARVGKTIEPLSQWTAKGLDSVEVRDFCAECNSGFMNDFDHGVKAQFATPCSGSPAELDQDAIGRWAGWAVKQYFSYQCAYPEDLSRPEDFHWFYEHRRPLAGMQVLPGTERRLAVAALSCASPTVPIRLGWTGR
jgi:hypothetical protein